MMTSRERILTVLDGKIPDRVPWIENYVSNEVAQGLLGHANFFQATYSQKVQKPGMIRIPPAIREVIPLDNISYDMSPPRYAKTEKIGGLDHVTEGLIKTKDDLKLLDTLPDPDDPLLYREAEAYLREFKGDSAAIATVRTGISNTYLSMGIEHFCISIILEPELVKDILWRFSEWSLRVVKNIQELPFDLFFIPDDIGFGNAPMISPDSFRKFCIPTMEKVIDAMQQPAIYHSDGNILPLMEDIIGLGVKGVANVEPAAIDIEQLKRDFGNRITIVGNIDLNYTLSNGTPEETEEEVQRRIKAIGPGGRYILASANSLPHYVKAANVRAMGEALLKYGFYPNPLNELRKE
jgi:uroporphyrinogen decarboxylase